MPEDDPDSFSMLLSWVYLDKIERCEFIDNNKKPVMDPGRYIKLFAMAEKLNIIGLADSTMDYYVKTMASEKQAPGPPSLRLAYNLTPVGSRLRIFMARSLKHLILTYGNKYHTASWSNDVLHKVMVECPDLGKDTFALLREQSGSVSADPRTAPSCDYHRHSADEPCPYKKA